MSERSIAVPEIDEEGGLPAIPSWLDEWHIYPGRSKYYHARVLCACCVHSAGGLAAASCCLPVLLPVPFVSPSTSVDVVGLVVFLSSCSLRCLFLCLWQALVARCACAS